MNVLLIISDTMRRDCVGCYGAPAWARKFQTGIGSVDTPNLDGFAKRALVFENAFIASFPTVPTRNDVLTGRYTWTYKPWAPLGQEVTLQETLNAAGVFTGLVVDTPHPFAPGFNYQRGFQTWELIRGQEHDGWQGQPAEVSLPCAPHKLRSPDRTVVQYLRNMSIRSREEDYFPARTFREAAIWLERNRGRQPFFLYVDTFDPHEPWDPPDHYVDRYDPGYQGESVIYPRYDRCDYLSAAELNHCRALYAGEVTMVDHWFGYLMRRMEALDLQDDTVIFFLSDHGFYLGEHGYIGKSLLTPEYQQAVPLYPEVARIPMLVHVPEKLRNRPRQAASKPLDFARGRRANQQTLRLRSVPAASQPIRLGHYIQTADLMPTICDLMNAPIPASVRSRSFAPLLRGEKSRDAGFAICSPTISHPQLEVPHPTTRTSVYAGDWLLVYGAQVDRVSDAETTQMVDSVLRRVASLEKGPIRPQLFDLKSDPQAKRNVIRKHADVFRRLHSRLEQFLEENEVPERHLRFFR